MSIPVLGSSIRDEGEKECGLRGRIERREGHPQFFRCGSRDGESKERERKAWERGAELVPERSRSFFRGWRSRVHDGGHVAFERNTLAAGPLG